MSSSGRTSPGPRKTYGQTESQSQNVRPSPHQDLPPRPKSPFSMPFRSLGKKDANTGNGQSASQRKTSSSAQGSMDQSPQPGQRRGIFRKKSISSMSMLSIGGDHPEENLGNAAVSSSSSSALGPASPSSTVFTIAPSPVISRAPHQPPSTPSSPSTDTTGSSSSRLAKHRRSASYSGIIESAAKAQKEMESEASPKSSRKHIRSPSASKISVSASMDAAYAQRTRQQQLKSPSSAGHGSPRRVYGEDDVQNYIKSGKPSHSLNSDAANSEDHSGPASKTLNPSRPQTPDNSSTHRSTTPMGTMEKPSMQRDDSFHSMQSFQSTSSHARSPSLLERASRAAGRGNLARFGRASEVTQSPSVNSGNSHGDTEDLLPSSANTSKGDLPANPSTSHSVDSIRSASVLGIRAEDEPASRTGSPSSRVPRSAGFRSQLSRSGSTASRRSFFEWVGGAASSSNNNTNNDNDSHNNGGNATGIKLPSTQIPQQTIPRKAVPQSTLRQESISQGSSGLRFPASSQQVPRPSTALGDVFDRQTLSHPLYPQAQRQPRLPAGTGSSEATRLQQQQGSDRRPGQHAHSPSQASVYGTSRPPTPPGKEHVHTTPTKQPSSGIPFYRRLRTQSGSSKSILNGATLKSEKQEGEPSYATRASGAESAQEHPPRAPSALGGFFAGLQKTMSRDELQQQQQTSPRNKLSTFGGFRRARAETSLGPGKRTTKDSISTPVPGNASDGLGQKVAQPALKSAADSDRFDSDRFRSASAMSFRDDDVAIPRSPASKMQSTFPRQEISPSSRATLATPEASPVARPDKNGITSKPSAIPRYSHSPKSPSVSGLSMHGKSVDSGRIRRHGDEAQSARGTANSSASISSSRDSIFGFPSSKPNTHGNNGPQVVTAGLRQAGKRGWGMVKGGWKGHAGGQTTEEEDNSSSLVSNKARKSNRADVSTVSIPASPSVEQGTSDPVLQKWNSIPEAISSEILTSSSNGVQSLIFGIPLRDAVIRTRLISPHVEEYLAACEATSRSSSRSGHHGSASGDDPVQHQADRKNPANTKGWHQTKRSDSSMNKQDEAPSHLRKIRPQIQPRRRPSRIGLLDLGSEFSLASEFSWGEQQFVDAEDGTAETGEGPGQGLDGMQTSRQENSPRKGSIVRVPVDRLKARRQYLPRFVTRCIESLETYGLTEEGVYRLSGRSSHTARLRALFDGRLEAGTGEAGSFTSMNKEDFPWDLDLKHLDPIECDINSVCSVLKAYLRELPAPVLDRERIKSLSLEAQKVEKGKAAPSKSDHERYQVDATLMANVLSDMDPSPWYLLRELAFHLGDITQEHVVAKTKMPLSNLSLVLAPTLSIPLTTLAFVVSQREVLFQQGPKDDAYLDKVREGDVIGGVVGRDSERDLKAYREMTSTSSSTSSPSLSSPAPSTFAGSTFSFTMRSTPPLVDAQDKDRETTNSYKFSSSAQPRSSQDMARIRGISERNHNRDSSASDATILPGSFASHPAMMRSPSPDGDSHDGSDLFSSQAHRSNHHIGERQEPREILRGAYQGSNRVQSDSHSFTHSASNSGSTWGSSTTDYTADTHYSTDRESRKSAANSQAPGPEERQGLKSAPSRSAAPLLRSRDGADGIDADGDSTLSAPGSPATTSGRGQMTAFGTRSHDVGGPRLHNSASSSSFASGISASASNRSLYSPGYPTSPASPAARRGLQTSESRSLRGTPQTPSSAVFPHSPSYGSLSSDKPGHRSGRTSALDRPRPVASGSGSFFGGGLSSSGGHAKTRKASISGRSP
ncbi:unnamed protein product [Sympodiomycopsis kandeliae]